MELLWMIENPKKYEMPDVLIVSIQDTKHGQVGEIETHCQFFEPAQNRDDGYRKS